MANYIVALDDVFYALGDPTRRAIVARLAKGAAAVTELAAPFTMALPSFLKHVGVLERAGLIRSKKEGRTRVCMLEQARLRNAERWIAEQRAAWESRSDRMAAYVEQLHERKKTRDRK